MNDLKPVAHRYRWLDISPHSVTGGQWYPWETCDESKYNEMLEYITAGYSYEAEKLYAIPPTHRVVSVESIKEVIDALEEGYTDTPLAMLRAIIDNK